MKIKEDIEEIKQKYNKFKQLSTFKKTGIIVDFIFTIVMLYFAYKFLMLLWAGMGLTLIWIHENMNIQGNMLGALM